MGRVSQWVRSCRRLPAVSVRNWKSSSEIEHRSYYSSFLFFYMFYFSCLVSKKTGFYVVHSSGAALGAHSPMTMAVNSSMAALRSKVVRHCLVDFYVI